MLDSSWIKIGRPWPSLNELFASHWRVKQQWRDYFRLQGRAEILVRMIQIPEPLDCYVANIEFLRVSSKELDPTDNLPGGAKPLIDGLKASRVVWCGKKPLRNDGYPERYWGLFADDNKKYLKATVSQQITSNTDDHGSYIRVKWEKLTERVEA